MSNEEGSGDGIRSRARDGVPETALFHEERASPATGHAELERPAASALGHAEEEAVFSRAQPQSSALDPRPADEMHIPQRRVGSADPRLLAPERDPRPFRGEKDDGMAPHDDPPLDEAGSSQDHHPPPRVESDRAVRGIPELGMSGRGGTLLEPDPAVVVGEGSQRLHPDRNRHEYPAESPGARHAL